jgi:hypothetical protein
VELVTWIVLGILGVFGAIVLIPVLVVGTWFVVMTGILGLVDGIVWLLDQRWKHEKRSLLVGHPGPIAAGSRKPVLAG